jgi:peptidyl-prolyl cis-trans isomerase B (cyclophilin B)
VPRSTILFSFLPVLAVLGGDEAFAPARSPVTVTLACSRQAVSATEAFPVRLTVANDGSPVTFDRADLVPARCLVAATYDRKGQWVTIPEPAAPGKVELRAGESFTIETRVVLPEALTKSPTSLVLQWVGSTGALESLRSNEINVAVRNDQNPTVTLETGEGTIVLELWPDKAPNHVANFLTLAKSGFYDGRIFHRVIPNFMVQTGCPQGTGMGDPGYKIPAEFSDAPFGKGVLGMARSNTPDSAGSQFFICVADSPQVKALDKQYTAFGRVIEGQEAADKIALVPRDAEKGDRPYKDVPLKKATASLPPAYTLPPVKKVGDAPTPESAPESRR